MRHFDIPGAFCPSVGTHPNIDYSNVVTSALKSYPGAKGDAVTALSFYAKHRDMAIDNARKSISMYLRGIANDTAAEEYKNSWVSRYVDYLEN